ncbi:MAG: SUMF1/EgtB/PvdO family nonheme iron enzyme [Motiliproteus sp.]
MLAVQRAAQAAQNGQLQQWAIDQGKQQIGQQIDQMVGLNQTRQADNAIDAFSNRLQLTEEQIFAFASKQAANSAIDGNGVQIDADSLRLTAAQGLALGVEDALSYSDIAVLSSLEVEVGKAERRDWDLSIKGLHPLWSSDDRRHNLFMQGGVEYFKYNDRQRTGSNLGTGYRQLSADQRWFWGTNLFFDHENPYGHQRASLGFELETAQLRVNTNIYHALSRWQDSRSHYQERALDGIDLELSGLIPSFPQLRVGLRGYQWDRHDGLDNLDGTEASLEYTHSTLLGIELNADDNNTQQLNWGAKVSVNYRFGVPLTDQLRPQSDAELLDVKNRLLRKVEREYRIRTQEQLHQDIVGTISLSSGNNSLNGAAVILNSYLYVGSTLTVENTATDTARLRVSFNDGAMLEVGDGSSIQILQGQVRLIRGVLRYTSNGAPRVLSSLNATVTLSGTITELWDEGEDSVARVTQGRIGMTVAGNTLDLQAGGNEIGCSDNGAAPTTCSIGDPIYDSFATELNNRLDGNLSTLPGTFAFSLIDQTRVALNTQVESVPITLANLSGVVAISIAGGEYSLNGGSYTRSAGTANNGDTVTVRLTSSASYTTVSSATLTVDGLSDNFDVTTQTLSLSTIDIQMVSINASRQRFDMGCGSNNLDSNCQTEEQPEHQVTFANSFEMSAHEITFAAWDACVTDGGCTHNPSDEDWSRGARPVINVSYDDITTQFIPWLNSKTGQTYRLPTEAEWEYAARAGSAGVYSWGNSIGSNNANCGSTACGDSYANTAPVGSFAASAFGLYDMHGNVYELTSDIFNSDYTGSPTDGSARTSGSMGPSVVIRGASWKFDPSYLRSASRASYLPSARGDHVGFRLVKSL